MYKIYFGQRYAILREELSAFPEKSGKLQYDFGDTRGLKEVLSFFHRSEHIGELGIVHRDLEMLANEVRSCFRTIYAAGGLVRDPEGKYLMIKRNGMWDLPKGKLEKGEDFEEGALREVGEETGLRQLEILQFLVSTFHTYELKGKLVLKETRWFEMIYKGSAEPVLQGKEGITSYTWTVPGREHLPASPAWPNILDVLKLRSLI
jgi:8-oxo-dGTP pyrophosphatase MutT (NUDIX family)